MSFLQPWLLFGLPLVALPILIHLINQRRFQTIPWAAMMFLLSAFRMNRGYSRLRQWLIMAMRMLAIAGLVFAVSRPLAGGWLGLAAGDRADTTLVLVDRSPSMQQRGEGGGESKLQTGRHQLTRILDTIGSNRWILIDGATCEPRALQSASALPEVPNAGPASSSSDLPRMLQAALDYVRGNRTGRTEIWICSDLRQNDWSADSGRWPVLRQAFLGLSQGVRFHLLAYPRPAVDNVAVRVTDVRRRQTSEGAEVLVSVRLSRQTTSDDKKTLPVQIEIEGARSVVPVELSGARVDLREHPIPIERTRQRGWGRVSIPTDVNPADDDFYFVFDDPPPRRTILVADDPSGVRPLLLAAEIPTDPAAQCSAELLTPEQLTGVEWDQVSLVLWQSALPGDVGADLLQSFVNRGGQVVFFPPREPGDREVFGVRWKTWSKETERIPVETWRGDEDLLARTLSGAALPVGEIDVRQYCGLTGEFTALATLRGGSPLLARVPSRHGGVYFWTTTVAPRDSSLGTNGVVLYAFVQRALSAGAAVLGKARQIDAGDTFPDTVGDDPADWSRVAGAEDGLSTESAYHRGVYRDGERLLAVNRSQAEDDAAVLANSRVDALFDGLDFVRVDDQAGNAGSLIQEIWRAFLIAMLLAMILEAVLCLPKWTRIAGGAP